MKMPIKMSNPDAEASKRFEAIREDAISVLQDLTEKARAFELPEPPGALEQYRLKLVENAYKMLVVGEAKRGKSTFVNALIGRAVLPTDVENATSQVFNVRSAEREAYRLRFEDGSVQQITFADLRRFGLQEPPSDDPDDPPRLDRIVRWIEVDVPVRFLPEGMSILDTPGLGALYAAHAQITYRFLPHADAVIYVLDSDRPLLQTDLDYVETILSVTRNIFFVQTMIDKYGSDHWQEIRRRNQRILEDRFKDLLPDTRVWPVSSTHLLEAAASERYAEAYLAMSGQRELEAALRAFLNSVVGFGDSAKDMLVVAERYHTASHETLSGRLASVEDPKHQRAESSRITERNQKFNRDWGPQGKKRKELFEDLRRAADLGKRGFVEALGPGGDIVVTHEAKIDAMRSFEEARQIGTDMAGEVVARALNTWNQQCEWVWSRFVELLGPFVEEGDVITPFAGDVTDLNVTDARLTKEFKLDFVKAFRSSGGIMIFTSVSAVLASGQWYLAVPVLLMAAKGLHDNFEGQRKSAQQDLHKNLSIVLQRVRRHFLGTDAASGRYSRVEEYFDALQDSIASQVQVVAKQKSEETRKEIDRLKKDANLHDQERRARIEQARRHLAAWEEMGKALEDVGKAVEAVTVAVAAQNQLPASPNVG
jgi:GTPase SAR1 family protein